MNNNEFNQSREELFSICKSITDKKGRDYTKGNHDVLSHFSESASSFGMTKYQNLGTFLKKHIDAIYNYIKSNGQSESEPIQSRIADAINFLTFFNAMVLEDNKNVSSQSSNDVTIPHFFTFVGTDSLTTKIVEMFNDRVLCKQIDISEYTNKLVTNANIKHTTPVFEACLLNGYNKHDVLPVIKDNLSKYFNLLKNIITEDGRDYILDYRLSAPENGITTIQLFIANKISSTHDISKVIYKLLRSETESNLINGTNLTLPLYLNVDIEKIDAIDDHILKGTSKLVEPITGYVFSIKNLDSNYTKQLSELNMNKRIFFNINKGTNVTDIYTKPKNTVNVVEYLGKSRIDNSPLFAIYIV